MIIERVSKLTGKLHKKEINITEEQLEQFNRGVLVQRAFPKLSSDDREFILTGITAEEWKEEFGDD